MKSSNEGRNSGPLHSPMAPYKVGSGKVPPTADNTTMKGTAPRSAPIVSPQAPSVIKNVK